MEYRLAEGSFPADLEREVNGAIKLGWEPIGGVCSDTSFGSGNAMYQAMIFRGEE